MNILLKNYVNYLKFFFSYILRTFYLLNCQGHRIFISVGEKPKTGPASVIGLGNFFPNFSGSIFSTFKLSQNLAAGLVKKNEKKNWLGK